MLALVDGPFGCPPIIDFHTDWNLSIQASTRGDSQDGIERPDHVDASKFNDFGKCEYFVQEPCVRDGGSRQYYIPLDTAKP